MATKKRVVPAMLLAAAGSWAGQSVWAGAAAAGSGVGAVVPVSHSAATVELTASRDRGSISDRFHAKAKAHSRETRRELYHRSFGHFRHELHPECPPYCSPSWGYHQTCWRQFPEETLWCPTCPTVVSTVTPPVPTLMPTPADAVVSPPPQPPVPELAPEAPAAPLVEPEAPAEESAEDMSRFDAELPVEVPVYEPAVVEPTRYDAAVEPPAERFETAATLPTAEEIAPPEAEPAIRPDNLWRAREPEFEAGEPLPEYQPEAAPVIRPENRWRVQE